jgi:iron(III) transport system ATP-binding protein
MTELLRIDNVSVAYGPQPVFSELSLSLEDGEVGCLLGASGSGKSSLLRAIAGFEPIQKGEIQLSGKSVSKPSFSVPAHQRGVGMVFQDHALFPHLTVEQNVAFGLQKSSKPERKERVIELLQLIGLAGRCSAYPHELSGGQQQRVALARALAPRPKLILLDEPFASLDSDLRRQLSMDVRDVLKATNTAALMVTHDQHEAFSMADKLGLIARGQLQQWDNPYRIYHSPANRVVAEFVGEGVFLPTQVSGEINVTTSFGDFSSQNPLGVDADTKVEMLIRPDDVLYDENSDVRATIVARQFRGAEFFYTLELKGHQKIYALFPSHLDYAIGENIGIRLELDHVITFPAS